MSLVSAVKAGIPIISCTFRDVLNLDTVLHHYLGPSLSPLPDNNVLPAGKGKIYLSYGDPKDRASLYRKLVKHQQVVIVINPAKSHYTYFDIGEIPIPKQLIADEVDEIADTAAQAKEIMKALGGCSLKETVEFMRLAMVETGELTAKAIVHVRKQYFQEQVGVTHINTDDEFYVAPPELSHYIDKEQKFFLGDYHPKLTPRGLLLDGPPGTGKTSAAKEIARRWGIPLYRIDLAGMIDRYQGVSEKQLLNGLQRLDQEEPCAVLFDEIEKAAYAGPGDNGTKSGMLSQLLWWLAEHRSKVFTIMTTNKVAAIPRELWRPGRIDKKIYMGGMELSDAKAFGVAVAKQFKVNLPKDAIFKSVEAVMVTDNLGTNPTTVSHAAVTEAVYALIKSS